MPSNVQELIQLAEFDPGSDVRLAVHDYEPIVNRFQDSLRLVEELRCPCVVAVASLRPSQIDVSEGDAAMVAVSSGRSERRLITSALMPCSASFSAACIAMPTMIEKATAKLNTGLPSGHFVE